MERACVVEREEALTLRRERKGRKGLSWIRQESQEKT